MTSVHKLVGKKRAAMIRMMVGMSVAGIKMAFSNPNEFPISMRVHRTMAASWVACGMDALKSNWGWTMPCLF